MSVGWVMLALFWLCFCPIFYIRVFLPCWDCFDFESTMAHEIGHVLGFNHPDTFTGANLVATGDGVMGPDVCMDPLRHVQLMPLPEGADSIMFSVTKARDRTCLTADDVQARKRLEKRLALPGLAATPLHITSCVAPLSLAPVRTRDRVCTTSTRRARAPTPSRSASRSGAPPAISDCSSRWRCRTF